MDLNPRTVASIALLSALLLSGCLGVGGASAAPQPTPVANVTATTQGVVLPTSTSTTSSSTTSTTDPFITNCESLNSSGYSYLSGNYCLAFSSNPQGSPINLSTDTSSQPTYSVDWSAFSTLATSYSGTLWQPTLTIISKSTPASQLSFNASCTIESSGRVVPIELQFTHSNYLSSTAVLGYYLFSNLTDNFDPNPTNGSFEEYSPQSCTITVNDSKGNSASQNLSYLQSTQYVPITQLVDPLLQPGALVPAGRVYLGLDGIDRTTIFPAGGQSAIFKIYDSTGKVLDGFSIGPNQNYSNYGITVHDYSAIWGNGADSYAAFSITGQIN